jgi:hypothetical protein
MKSEKQQMDVLSVVKEFVQRIDEIYGLYLDATKGFQENVKSLEKGQEEALKKGIKVEWRDDSKFFFGRGNPNDPKSVLLHTTTFGEYRQRNLEGGSNHRLLAQYFVVLVYHLWDNEYRPRIAEVLGCSDSNSLKLPICGDLRLLRHDILKHRGVITKEKQTKLEVLKQIPAEQLLNLSSDNVEQIMSAIKKAVDDLVVAHVGVDPKHRTIWHMAGSNPSPIDERDDKPKL